MKARVLAFSVLIILVLAVPMVFAAGGQEKKNLTVGAIMLTLEHPFFITYKNGIEETAAKLGIKTVIYDSQFDVAKQANQIDDLIAQKVDAIILNPVEPEAAIDMIKKCNAANIPVIVQASHLNAKVATTVKTDDLKLGRIAGENSAKWINANLGGNGKIVLFDWPKFGNTKDWEDGFVQKIKELSPASTFVASIPGTSKEEGLKGMEDVLQAHPDVNFIYGINDPVALGAIQAVTAAGRTNIYGTYISGGDEEGFKRLQSGTKDGLLIGFVQIYPHEIGQFCLQAAYDAANGKNLPDTIYTEGVWWSEENAKAYASVYPNPPKK